MPEPRVVLHGLAIGESPRWHDHRLWFANWGPREIVALDADGHSQVMGHGTSELGYSIDWLPSGELLVTGSALMRQQPDGSLLPHADLSAFPGFSWNEIVVDGRGNIYINGLNFRFGYEAFRPGIIALVTPDSAVRQVADDIAFPNGTVITPDNSTLIISESFSGRLIAFNIEADGSLSNRRVWAEGLGPDGICMDAEGAIWVQTRDTGPFWGVVRVREGGEVLQRIEHDRAIFAAMLGGPNRTTLFLLAAQWRGIEQVNEAVVARTGQVLVSQAPVPGAGWP
jgi:sugar lactone lactonase YvrE